jgi:hypothetical protein
LFNFGHSWWNLNINPTNINPYLIGADPYNSVPVNLSLGDPFGPQGMGGFYDHTNVIGPGQVIFANPQPDLSAATNHVATGSYYWCLSFANYLSVLQNVWDLSTYPPEYRFASVNCTTEAEAMAIAGGIQNVPPTIYPGYLSKWLNGIAVVFTGNPLTYQLPEPPTCSCQ